MKHLPFNPPITLNDDEILKESASFYQWMEARRSLRFFSSRPIERQVIENLIMTASTAPSGANKQPWTFCAVSSPIIKKRIREAAEEEEYRSYNGRMSQEWLEDLAPFGTDWQKPFLEIAPWVIVIFRRGYELEKNGHKHPNYYVNESVGLACGVLLTAIHQLGLVALTHTPSPMDFLTKILKRPVNEKPFLLIPVGFPAEEATVPNIIRKSKEEVLIWFE
ncbi:MAG: nitroreductase family protein [Spirosomataceae bacterium]